MVTYHARTLNENNRYRFDTLIALLLNKVIGGTQCSREKFGPGNQIEKKRMSEIELSTVVIDGLKSLNTVISSDLTKKIISNAVKIALHSDASKSG